MLKAAITILFILAFIAPVVTLIFIIDKKRNGLLMFIEGIVFYIVVETCIKLPVLGYLGYGDTDSSLYMLVLCMAGALFVEIIQYFVIKCYTKKKMFSLDKLVLFAAGFICAYVFVIWGIDSVGAAAVIFLDDFKLMSAFEIWIEIIKILIMLPLQCGIIFLCADTIKFKRASYFLAAVFIKALTDTDMVFYFFEKIGLGEGISILYLAIMCVIIIMFIRKQIVLWKGSSNESIEKE